MNGTSEMEANPIASEVANARKWALRVTIAGAVMATGLSYIFITQFFIDIAGMEQPLAMAFGGFLEVCLIAAGLQARHRILAGQSADVLITLTWIFSGISAGLSASHEIVHLDASGVPVLDLSSGSPLTMIVRAVAPLVAAVMWHLLLVGEQHMVSGRPRGYRKSAGLVHVYMLAREEHRDLEAMGSGPEVVEEARRNMNAARAEVFRKVPLPVFRLLLEERLAAMAADFDGSARVDRMSEIRKPAPARKPLPPTEGGRSVKRRRVARQVPAVASGTPKPEAEAEAEQPALAVVPEPATDLDKEARNMMIVEMDANGHRQTDIAERFGVSTRQVRNIVTAAKNPA